MRSYTFLRTCLGGCEHPLSCEAPVLVTDLNDRKHIQFQPFTPKDIVRISEVEVSATELYKNHENGIRTAAEGGALDGRMVRTEPFDT